MTATAEELIQFAAHAAARPSSITVREVIAETRDGRPVHVVHNDDLRVAMGRAKDCDAPQVSIDDTGLVVIAIGVDSGNQIAYGHDAVHFCTGVNVTSVQLIEQAIAALEQSRDALLRVEAQR